MYIYANIKNDIISIEKIEEDQKRTKGNPKYKSKVQLHIIENIKNLYKSITKIIRSYNDYAKIRS